MHTLADVSVGVAAAAAAASTTSASFSIRLSMRFSEEYPPPPANQYGEWGESGVGGW